MARKLAFATVFCLMTSGYALADEIRVVTVGGLQRGLAPIAADFAKSSNHQVKFTFTNPANLQKTLASEGPFDVAIVAASSVDELDNAAVRDIEFTVKIKGPGI